MQQNYGSTPDKACRCGFSGEGPHGCHKYQPDGSRCGKPASQRFYHLGPPASLAGMQLKFSVQETWACDEHWEEYQEYLKEGRKVHGAGG